MFIGEASTQIRRPLLALCLAAAACLGAAAASASWMSLSLARLEAPVLLARSGALDQSTPVGSVWVVTSARCAACPRVRDVDAALLTDAGARIQFVRVSDPGQGGASLLRLIGGSAEASQDQVGSTLSRTLADNGVVLNAPYFIWRGGDGAWRAASAAEAGAARVVAADIQPAR